MTVDAARPRSWGVARLSFGMPKNVGQAALHSQVEAIRSRWSQIVKSQFENQIKCKNNAKE